MLVRRRDRGACTNTFRQLTSLAGRWLMPQLTATLCLASKASSLGALPPNAALRRLQWSYLRGNQHASSLTQPRIWPPRPYSNLARPIIPSFRALISAWNENSQDPRETARSPSVRHGPLPCIGSDGPMRTAGSSIARPHCIGNASLRSTPTWGLCTARTTT